MDDQQTAEAWASRQAEEKDDLGLHGKEELAEEGAASPARGILVTIEEMKDGAEESLTNARQTEAKSNNAFELMEQGLQKDIKVSMDEKPNTTRPLGSKPEELGKYGVGAVETASG